MRKLKVLWQSARSSRLFEEIETWASVLLVLGAALLLYATLKAQTAAAEELLPDLGAPTPLESTMAAGARSTPWDEAYAHAVLAPGMPPEGTELLGRSS